jgi:hypothetical protein
MTPFQRAAYDLSDVRQRAIAFGVAEAVIREALRGDVWLNDRYQVHVKDSGDFLHLSVKRIDKEPVHDWRDLQEIKNQIVGPECEAVELYPAESRRVDSANQYHLWAVKDPSYRFPFGFGERLVSEEEVAGTRQRPFGREEKS